MNCRFLISTVGLRTCRYTCNTGTSRALREPLGVSRCWLMGWSPTVSLALDSHVHVCVLGSRVYSRCKMH